MAKKESVEKTVNNIRRQTRKKYSAEDKIRSVLEGLRGETTIAELCRREGINSNLYYRWSKEFLEAGKQRLADNTKREADSEEVKEMKSENNQLKQLVAEFAAVTSPGFITGSQQPLKYRIHHEPISFNTFRARNVTHLLACFFGPQSSQVLPV